MLAAHKPVLQTDAKLKRYSTLFAAYLERKFDMSPQRLDVVGLGSDRPLVPTPTQTPEARNRRLEIINLGA